MSKNTNEKIKNYTAQTEWAKRKGYQSKSYKLPIDVVEQFAEACKKANVSKSKQLTSMMKEFIKKADEKTE